MQISPTITITGIDERTSIPLMADLIQRHPALEIGLLLTLSPEGRHRYPGRGWLAAAAAALSGRCALHVCGSGARAALAEGELQDLTTHAARIQVNGTLDVEAVEALAEGYPNHTLITQFNGANADHLQVRAGNHALLIDASGGRGLAPGTWVRPLTSKAVGFAGGLGPLTLAHELPQIHAVARGPWWIDMETSVRDATDWFDAQRAHKAIGAFEDWLAATPGAPAEAITAASCWHPALDPTTSDMLRPWTVRRANGHSWQYLLATQRAQGGAEVKRRWGSEQAARAAAQRANAGDGAR